MTLAEFATHVDAKLAALKAERELLNGAYGDDRGATYAGSMEADLAEFVWLVTQLYFNRVKGLPDDTEHHRSRR